MAFASAESATEWTAVLGAATAAIVVVPIGDDWWALPTDGLTVEEHKSLDPTRRLATVRLDAAPQGHRLGPEPRPGLVRDLAATLLAAESAGGSAWCVDTASAYAKDRQQFGRPIGQFQAVKHLCADMLGALELARAVAWDAARGGDDDEVALAAAVAGAIAPEAFARCAQGCVQVHGGIGFTWEHDAHLFLRRAMATRQLLGGEEAWNDLVVERARGGARRSMTVDLPPEAEGHRAEVRAFLEDLRGQDRAEWDLRIAEAGWLVPNWPSPWGRDADPIEQLVIDEEFREAHVRRRHLQVGAWVLPTLIVHGNAEQQERFIGPTLAGEILWCQMFSEPGAGSDLASLSTRAERVEGGWAITGQKVWTTMAHIADWGICLARTNPNAAKHLGISCFLVDLKTPGIDVRPLRELTGAEMFNEVFFDAVFVPDDLVVGEIDAGWEAARTTLGQRAGVDGQRWVVRSRRRGPPGQGHRGRLAGRPRPRGAPAGREPRPRCARLALDAAGPDRGRARPGGQRAQAPRGRARAAHPGAGPRPARPGRCDRRGRRGGLDRRLPRQSLPVHRRWHQRDPAQRDRRTPPRPPQGSLEGTRDMRRTIAFDLDGTLSDWEAAIRLAEPEHGEAPARGPRRPSSP